MRFKLCCVCYAVMAARPRLDGVGCATTNDDDEGVATAAANADDDDEDGGKDDDGLVGARSRPSPTSPLSDCRPS